MKQLLLICLFVCLESSARAQTDSVQEWRGRWQYGTDSLIRLQSALDLAGFYLHNNLDSCLYFSYRGLSLSLRLPKHPKLSDAYRLIGSANVNLGNYPTALEYYDRAIDLDDSMENRRLLAVDYYGLFVLYARRNQLDSGVAWLWKGMQIVSPNDTGALGYVLPALARYHLKRQEMDSALQYARKFNDLVLHWKREDWKADDWELFGQIAEDQGKDSQAYVNYHNSFLIARQAKNDYLLCNALISEAALFDRQNDQQRAMGVYADVLQFSKHRFPNIQLICSSYLADTYAASQKWDSAYLFSVMTSGLERKLRNDDSVAALTNLAYQRDEQKRQRDVMREEASHRRSKNIQLFSIAFFIPCFYVFVLYLKRREISKRMVKVLGLFALLMGFEFFNFLVHPWLEHWFHDNQYLVFASLVVIAMGVARAHHRMEEIVAERLGAD